MNWANHQIRKPASDLSQRLRVFMLTILFAVASPLSMAQLNSAPDSEQAGRIIMVSGQVIARDSTGSARQLSRRSRIFVGDTILTGPAASTQIRMVDDARISLKADTEFTIVAYQYDENIVTDVVSLSLIQGGFRTITGVIGDQNKEAYEATISNFATIGIRGTDYEVVITPAGEIFTGVYDGGTTIANAAGELDLGLGVLFDFATVPDPQTPPQGLTAQPAELGIIPLAVFDQDTEEEDTGSEDDGGDVDGDGGDDGDNDGDANATAPASNADSSQDTTDTTTEITLGTGATTPSNTVSVTGFQNTTDDSATGITALSLTSAASDVGAAASQQATTTSALSVNPNESSGDGSISCSADASCPEIEDGKAQAPDANANASNDNSTSDDNSTANTDSSDDDSPGNSGNAGNSGVGNSGNNDDNNSAADTDSSDDDSPGNSGNAGNSGVGNSGNNDDDNSAVDTDSSDDDSPGNSGNAGNNGVGNSSNSGNGNNSSKLTRAPADSATNEDFSISWGKWDRSIDANWGIVTRVNDALTIVSTSKYFAEVNPTPVANLKGIASYGSGLVSSFIGSGSAGEINSLLATMDVNFDTGSITNGSLQVNVADQAWAIDFVGSVNGGVVGLGATAAQLWDSTGLISTSINANLGGLFTGNAAETFVGGFDLQDLINPLNSVEGIYTINR